MTERQHSLLVRSYYFGRKQLGRMYYDTLGTLGTLSSMQNLEQFWWFYLTEGRRLRKFKNIHEGKRCFIIGNGPSILKQDLTKLRDELSFVANSFVLHNYYDKIDPKYYCVSDPRYFDSNVADSEWYKIMMNKTRNSVKFLPSRSKHAIMRRNLFEGHDVFYLYYPAIPCRVWESGTINLDVTKPVYTGDTVIIDFCLPLVFYMGFIEIYLLGCDCDYGLDNDDSYKNAYFYNIEDDKTDRQTSDYLRRYWFNNVISSYKVAKKAFEGNGRNIYNAGIGGKLDVFERVNFDSITQRA
jgi:hypothetical protein